MLLIYYTYSISSLKKFLKYFAIIFGLRLWLAKQNWNMNSDHGVTHGPADVLADGLAPRPRWSPKKHETWATVEV